MAFDARAIKALQAGMHLTSHDHPGLRMEVGAQYRTWVYRYRSPIDGKLRQIKLGRFPAMSIHAAVVEWERLRQARDNGADPALAAREARKQVRAETARTGYTVAHVCDDYYEGHVRLSRAKKGATEIRRMFDKMLGDTANVPAADLTRAQAFDLIRSFAESAPVQAQNLRFELGSAWEYAIDAGKLPEATPNWWRRVLRGKIKSKGKKIAGQHIGTAKRVLSPEEVGRLINWLPNLSVLLQDVLTLYLWTACRGAEICGMLGSEVNREADGLHWWVIPKAKTKNARHANATDQRVPLYGRALNIILRRKERFGDGFLFPAKTRAGTLRATEQKTVQVGVYFHQPYSETRPEDERPRLPVTHWSPHDLRRTARTMLTAIGCPQDVAEAIVGHMQPGIVGTYNLHRYDAERADWLKRLSDHLETLTRRY